MKYNETTKLIQGLSKEYSIGGDDKSVFVLIYKNKPIAWVDKREQFNFGSVNISASGFDKSGWNDRNNIPFFFFSFFNWSCDKFTNCFD